ncbi:MAG: DUF488 domain-containing protein [Acidimicrobiia bacterium]
MTVTIYTIGHGREPFETIAALLHEAGVSTLIDIRSAPYSTHAPDFARPRLEQMCADAGIGYRFLGRHLGGKPTDPSLQGPDGRPDMARIAATPGFAADIGLLLEIAGGGPVAILCAEEDPANCHRSTVLAPALIDQGARVLHLRHDGTKQMHQEGLGI